MRLRRGCRLGPRRWNSTNFNQRPEKEVNMDEAITRSSRFLALSGVVGIIFPIVALGWPNITPVALAALFGAYARVAGVFTLVAGLDFATERPRHWVPI